MCLCVCVCVLRQCEFPWHKALQSKPNHVCHTNISCHWSVCVCVCVYVGYENILLRATIVTKLTKQCFVFVRVCVLEQRGMLTASRCGEVRQRRTLLNGDWNLTQTHHFHSKLCHFHTVFKVSAAVEWVRALPQPAVAPRAQPHKQEVQKKKASVSQGYGCFHTRANMLCKFPTSF